MVYLSRLTTSCTQKAHDIVHRVGERRLTTSCTLLESILPSRGGVWTPTPNKNRSIAARLCACCSEATGPATFSSRFLEAAAGCLSGSTGLTMAAGRPAGDSARNSYAALAPPRARAGHHQAVAATSRAEPSGSPAPRPLSGAAGLRRPDPARHGLDRSVPGRGHQSLCLSPPRYANAGHHPDPEYRPRGAKR
jgi:hypothetical protein